MISKSIERAQKKVEENNFGIRKHLLEYDDVMNTQREAIYKNRRHALYGDRLSIDISNMIYDVCEQTISDYKNYNDYEGVKLDLLKNLTIEPPFTEKEFQSKSVEELTEITFKSVSKTYKEKSELIAQKTYPVIAQVYENNSQYENIAIPITDGKKSMQVIANLKRAYEDKGQEVIKAIEKGICLGIIDNEWKEHLREMDDLKQSVQNASYEQKDPLLVYKLEAFNLFRNMMQKINSEITSFIIKGDLPININNVKEAEAPKKADMSKLKTSREDLLSESYSNTQTKSKQPFIRTEKKIGRNDPCPCGSGKKYKNCHGRGL